MRRIRKLFSGWRLFAAVVIALAALGYANDREARSAPLTAFLPANSDWAASSWNLPAAWSALVQGDALKRIDKEWSNPLSAFELAGRLGTGIRPTSVRWRIWLGYRAVLGHSPDGWGVCTYPGILLRWTDALRRLIGYKSDADGVYQYRSIFYAWRNGYLIASPSRTYVMAAAKSSGEIRLHSDVDALLTVQWEGEHEGLVHLRPGAGLPVDGQVRFACSDGERPLTLPYAWPERPIFSVTARNSEDLAQFWRAFDGALGGYPLYTSMRGHAAALARVWGMHAPGKDWDSGVNEISAALMHVDTDESIPVPSLGLALRYVDAVPEANPFQFLAGGRQVLPYEWSGCTGTMMPLLGPGLSPCFARCLHDWLAISNEPWMARTAGNMADGPACSADVDLAIRLSWKKSGDVAEPIALSLGDLELLPRMGQNDVRADVVPKIKALATLGELSIDGVARNGTLKFSGNLAQAPEGSKS